MEEGRSSLMSSRHTGRPAEKSQEIDCLFQPKDKKNHLARDVDYFPAILWDDT